MNSFSAMVIVGAIFVASVTASSQTGKHEPDFTLKISTEDETVTTQKNMDISISVVETNISKHTINAGRPSDSGDWYSMSVLLDGRPAPITERYREILNPKKLDPDVLQTGNGFVAKIDPGQSQTFEVPLTAFFDLSTPGKYKITFSRGTDRGRSNNVEVKSNTITITVLPSADQPSNQQ